MTGKGGVTHKSRNKRRVKWVADHARRINDPPYAVTRIAVGDEDEEADAFGGASAGGRNYIRPMALGSQSERPGQ
jgi:hypothetical protein